MWGGCPEKAPQRREGCKGCCRSAWDTVLQGRVGLLRQGQYSVMQRPESSWRETGLEAQE